MCAWAAERAAEATGSAAAAPRAATEAAESLPAAFPREHVSPAAVEIGASFAAVLAFWGSGRAAGPGA